VRNFDEHNITQAVLERVANAADPRTRQVSQALIRHLHDFIREIEPTFEEWQWAVQFLTDTGHMCSPTRQEFILLSDTLGASMLVDAINHRLPAGATETTVLGPFYVDNPPALPLGALISGEAEGVPMLVRGTVLTNEGAPIAGAVVDTWHSDHEGYYDVQHYDAGGGISMRARFHTDQIGRFYFWSIVPKYYPIPDDGPVGKMLAAQERHPFRPAHVHFMIEAPGFVKLITHIFFAGDKYIDSDAVFGVKESLIAELDRRPAGTAPDGRKVHRDYAILTYDFTLAMK
jgi:hydroxyquinol 1,2-dioxygenase